VRLNTRILLPPHPPGPDAVEVFPFDPLTVVAPTPAWAGPPARRLVRRILRLPPHPPGPDHSVRPAMLRSPVAPTPAWAGLALRRATSRATGLPPHPPGPDDRPYVTVGTDTSCPHTRLGRTLDPDWDLRVWKGPKSLSVHDRCVVEGLPMGVDAIEWLPADTASGQRQAF
jgi:hypothetical protein